MKVAEKLKYLSQIPQFTPILNTEPQSQEAFQNLLGLSEDFSDNTVEFLANAALYTDTDAYLPLSEKVALMSMHAAKGLEFPVVFIAGCENELIPLKREGLKQHERADMAEERRLFYVAMTRAMERLYLTRAKKRSVYGKLLSRSPSPFLADIENRLKKDDSPQIKKKKTSQQKQLELF
jgi:superfamily I DNA/RNA helicase